jgi:hypothetical protein
VIRFCNHADACTACLLDPGGDGCTGLDGAAEGSRSCDLLTTSGKMARAVYYSERGLESGLCSFPSEDLACRHLADLLWKDRTVRHDGA